MTSALCELLSWFLLSPSSCFLDFQGRNVEFYGDFETGDIQHQSISQDGWTFETTPVLQLDTEYLSSLDGDDVSIGSTVADGKIVGSPEIVAASGQYALRMRIDPAKNYQGINRGADKPRNNLRRFTEKIEFDQEYWLGFAIHLPPDYPIEETRNNPGQLILYQMHSITGVGPLTLKIESDEWVWEAANDPVNPGWVPGQGTIDEVAKLPIADDIGEWTCFVVRYRLNPYDEDCPCEGEDGNIYEANSGMLQIWQTAGDGSERLMRPIYSSNASPFGLAPFPEKNYNEFNLYKGGWRENVSSISEEITVYFDSIFWGRASGGTGYSDVQCEGAPQPTI